MVNLSIVLIVLISNYLVLYWILLIFPKRRIKNLIATKKFYISVVIPFRNEAENLPNVVQSLINQNLPKKDFEVIFVDDHSKDKSLEVLNNLLKNSDLNYNVLILEGSFGKKSALEKGFNASSGEIIIQTDADVILSPFWIEKHINEHNSHTTLLVCGAVDLIPKKGLLSQLQKIEMMALIQSSYLTININKPVMCNGANLSFKRQILPEVLNSYKKIESMSGDDVFLLHQVNEKYGSNSIVFLASSEGTVQTYTLEKINDLLKQRSRWAKKSKEYKNIFALYFTASVVFANISILVLQFISPLFNVEQFLLFTLTPFIIKCICDVLIVIDYKKSFGQKMPLYNYFYSIILELIYPVYILLVGSSILFRKQIWKGRMVR